MKQFLVITLLRIIAYGAMALLSFVPFMVLYGYNIIGFSWSIGLSLLMFFVVIDMEKTNNPKGLLNFIDHI